MFSPKAPRILLLSLSGQLGGMEMRIADLARLLRKIGCSPAIGINFFPELHDWVSTLREAGIPVTNFDPPPFFEEWKWRRLNKLRARIFSTRSLIQQKADLAHIFFAWTETGGSRLWLAHRCGIPSVISVHNAFPPHTFLPWHSRLMEEAFGSVKGIYAISESARDHFDAIYGRYIRPHTRFEVIHNCVNTARFVPSRERRAGAREAFGIPDDAMVLGSVGRLDKQKRPELLISVFAKLKEQYPSLYLILVGQGELEPAVRRQVADAGLGGCVIFAGFQNEVEKVLPALDLHLLFSRNEGFGTSTVEAMACGVPVVGTDVPGTADILRGSGAGILVPRDDEQAIVAAVMKLLENAVLREKMGQNGRIEAEQKFGKSKWESSIRNFYGEIVR